MRAYYPQRAPCRQNSLASPLSWNAGVLLLERRCRRSLQETKQILGSVTYNAPPMGSVSEELDRAGSVSIDNKSDDSTTILTVRVKEIAGVFRAVSLALQSEGLQTKKYAEDELGDGAVQHTFWITTEDNTKVRDDQLGDLQALISRAASRTASNLPAIYGLVQQATFRTSAPDVQQDSMEYIKEIETAATELVEAAGFVVELERQRLSKQVEEQEAVEEEVKIPTLPLQDRISEARSILRRKLAAMEALWKSSPTIEAPAVVPTRTEEAVLQQVYQQPKPSVGPAAGSGYEIVLQGFNWDSCNSRDWYRRLAEEAADIAGAGFTAVWFPPPTDSVSPQGYLPRDLYELNSHYGSQEELHSCVQAFHDRGIKVIADIVINHRCAHYQSNDGKWNRFGGRLAWDRWAICCNNHEFGGTGNHKTGEDYTAAPNLDHTNPKVREDLVEWLNYLRRSVGFDGWRFDFVKGYSGEYAKHYVDSSVPEMAFGEYWDTCEYSDCVLNYNQDNHRQRTINWIDSSGGTCAAFDFTTKGILQEAVSRREYWRLVDPQGRPPGLVGMWPSRAITFIENHDTGSSLQHWPFPTHGVGQGYAYCITHPGTPCIFYDHFKQTDGGVGEQIRQLLAVRKRNGIWFKSKVKIHKASGDVYAAVVDDKVAVKIGPGDWSPTSHKIDVGQQKWQMAVNGFQFAVWEAVF